MRDSTCLVPSVGGVTGRAASREPSAVMRLLADYQARLGPLLQAHGGSIDKFLGDGIMITFGAARAIRTHAADALHAVAAAMTAVDDWNRHRAAEDRKSTRLNSSH